MAEISSKENPNIAPELEKKPSLNENKKSFSLKKTALILIILIILIAVPGFIFLSRENKLIPPSTKPMPTSTPGALTPIPEISKNPAPTVAFVPGELIIKFKPGNSLEDLSQKRADEIEKIFDDLGIVSYKKLYGSPSSPGRGTYLLQFKKDVDLEQTAAELRKIPEIEYVEKNNIIEIQ